MAQSAVPRHQVGMDNTPRAQLTAPDSHGGATLHAQHSVDCLRSDTRAHASSDECKVTLQQINQAVRTHDSLVVQNSSSSDGGSQSQLENDGDDSKQLAHEDPFLRADSPCPHVYH